MMIMLNCVLIRPVTPYPGTDLYKYAIEHWMIKDIENFYEHKMLIQIY